MSEENGTVVEVTVETHAAPPTTPAEETAATGGTGDTASPAAESIIEQGAADIEAALSLAAEKEKELAEVRAELADKAAAVAKFEADLAEEKNARIADAETAAAKLAAAYAERDAAQAKVQAAIARAELAERTLAADPGALGKLSGAAPMPGTVANNPGAAWREIVAQYGGNYLAARRANPVAFAAYIKSKN